MEKQNLLMAALIYLIKFQSTHCVTARERALMMFEALAQLNESNQELDELCSQANALLAN
ncbi:hypothetical protein ICN42_04500 [Polynucleobacter sp. 71A-WALBACH]|uniref:hypothetical protein n=1 Tax=Polynucleobacter sp. 71A-WALBACH TaxID=2689097 RepID=UPI001C0D8A6C|nr:hypothetical protein [Polynucleobacter sp. 71A-WALBACH]MBU3593355.1 hypothetical protein [Polynucleobacter sp. 71A-WALBACH]